MKAISALTPQTSSLKLHTSALKFPLSAFWLSAFQLWIGACVVIIVPGTQNARMPSNELRERKGMKNVTQLRIAVNEHLYTAMRINSQICLAREMAPPVSAGSVSALQHLRLKFRCPIVPLISFPEFSFRNFSSLLFIGGSRRLVVLWHFAVFLSCVSVAQPAPA